MDTEEFVELFSLFHNLRGENLEWLESTIERKSYQAEEIIVDRDTWGKAVYFIISGWVKIQNVYPHKSVTFEILGKGGFFGEIEILHHFNFISQVMAISSVEIVSISAQRFIQILFRDPQIQHRLLKLMASRILEYQQNFQMYRQPAKLKLAKVLISLADKYGEVTETGTEIYNISEGDLADLAQIKVEESSAILAQLESKNLIKIEPELQTISFNLKQLHHVARKLTND